MLLGHWSHMKTINLISHNDKRCQNCDCTIVFSVQGMYICTLYIQSLGIQYRELQYVHQKIRVHSREKGYGEGGFGGLARPPSWSAHRIFGGEGGFGYITVQARF
jgi:hypothetical protein